MKQFLYRKLPDDFTRDIYIWDVDKTYLNTSFESKRGLLKIFIESSIDKRSIPGVKNLLLELRKGGKGEMDLSPIYFISASPVQLKQILEGKFLIDGVQHDGIVLKDYWTMRGLIGKLRIRNNFAYKLISLLTHRLEMPRHSGEILFGDDFEKDADVYSLYADILSYALDEQGVKWQLKGERLTHREIDKILEAVHVVQAVESQRTVVSKIFIHLIRKRELAAFKNYGDRLIPTRNYMQTAAILYGMGKISKDGFRRVANSFNLKYGNDGWTLLRSLEDLKERLLIRNDLFEELAYWK